MHAQLGVNTVKGTFNMLLSWNVILVLLVVTMNHISCEKIITDPPDPTGSSVIGSEVEEKTAMDKAIAPVYKMANIFLEVIIKPTDLTKLNASVDMSDFKAVVQSLQSDWQAWVKHYSVYIVCLVVGLVYILVIPITGCVICGCRKRGKCKADPNRKKKKVPTGSRRICTALFLLLCIGVLFGVVCMFLANEELHRHMEESGLPQALKDSVARLDKFLDVARSSFDMYLGTEIIPKVKTLRQKFNNLPGEVQKEVGTQTSIGPHMETLAAYTNQIRGIRDKLLKIDSNVDDIKAKTSTLSDKLTQLKANITRDFAGCTSSACEMMKNVSKSIATVADFTGVGKLNAASSAFTNVMTGTGNIFSSIQRAQAVYNQIQDAVRNGSRDIITSLSSDGDRVISAIESFLNSTLADLEDLLPIDDTRKVVSESVAPNIDKYGDYVYYICIGISAALLLVVALYFIGLLFGACGSQVAQATECCHKSASVSLLKAALGFMYIFACIIMIVVAVLFPIGGLLHNEVCRHLRLPAPDANSAQVMDDLITNSLNLPVSFLGVYGNCQKEQSLYTALQLQTRGEKFDLNKVLNPDDYSIKADLDAITNGTYDPGIMNIVSQQLLTNIADLRAATDNIDLTAHSAQLSKDIITDNLKSLSEDLSVMAANSTTQSDLLQFYATATDSIHQNEFSQVQVSTNNLRNLVSGVTSFRNKYNATETVLLLQQAQGDATATAVSSAVNSVSATLYNDFLALLGNAATSIRSNVAKCGPLAGIISDILEGVCTGMLQPFNAFWFSTGWCLIFFIFIIPIVTVLVDFYRMKPVYTTDSVDAASATSTTELVRNGRRRDSERSKYHGRPLPHPENTEPRAGRVPYEQLPVVSGARASPVQLPRHYQGSPRDPWNRSPDQGRANNQRSNERQWTNLAYDDTIDRLDRDDFNWTTDNHDPYQSNSRDQYQRSNARDQYSRDHDRDNYNHRSNDPYNQRSNRQSLYPGDGGW